MARSFSSSAPLSETVAIERLAMRFAPGCSGTRDAPGRDTGAGTRGLDGQPGDRKRAALHAKRIGGRLVQALVSLSQTNDTVSVR
jgi:hypothetical protein